MKRIQILLAALAVALLLGCGGSSNPMVGTWQMEMSEEVLKLMPKGQKPPSMSITFADDGTFKGTAAFGDETSEITGEYKLEGKSLTLTPKTEDGKPSNDKPETVTLADDMKSFPIPGSGAGEGKMVKK